MTHVPTDAKARKAIPLCTGALDYFPDALMAVAELSRIANEQHNPGEPMHWAKEKSTDEPDALLRHLVDRGKIDTDGTRHSAKVAWRALALLQREIDAERARPSGLTQTELEDFFLAEPVTGGEDVPRFCGPACDLAPGHRGHHAVTMTPGIHRVTSARLDTGRGYRPMIVLNGTDAALELDKTRGRA